MEKCLEYLGGVKARGLLVAAAAAVLVVLAVAAGASAHRGAQPRHVEFRSASNRVFIYLGERDGYEIGLVLDEPDFAVLYVEEFDPDTQVAATTAYGTHFEGPLAAGRIRARFGAIGSFAAHFVPDGKVRTGRLGKNCEGRHPQEEGGHFVGRIDLHGEGGYFDIASRRVGAYFNRTYRLRCRVRHAAPPPAGKTLREEMEYTSPSSFFGETRSSALLEAGVHEGDRRVDLIARHVEGSSPGADVMALEFESQGKMPVFRSASVPESPAGTLLTSLPGEQPATATLTPAAPFSGEASYLARSHLVHSWTGDLAVRFPGLLQPLTGPEFVSSLCVVSTLLTRYGCDFVPANWEPAE